MKKIKYPLWNNKSLKLMKDDCLFVILGDSSEMLQFQHPISPLKNTSLTWQQQQHMELIAH